MPTSWRITPTRPSIEIVPAVGLSSPIRTRSSVDLPTPLAPINATRSPLPTENEMSRNSSSPLGNFQLSCDTWIDPIAGA